ncbi:MAG: MBL fold metallo-hydrolase, partial [Acidimicrobiales bacterium]
MAPAPDRFWEDDAAEVHKVVVGRLDTNVYALCCRRTGAAVLIDGAGEAPVLVELCRRLGVERVLQTHGHHDHIGAVPALRRAGYPVAVAAADAALLAGHDEVLVDDQVVEVGRLRLRTIATPGHTPGSLCFALEGPTLEGSPLVFGGDTLFPGGPGATRWAYSDFATIVDSIDRRLLR